MFEPKNSDERFGHLFGNTHAKHWGLLKTKLKKCDETKKRITMIQPFEDEADHSLKHNRRRAITDVIL